MEDRYLMSVTTRGTYNSPAYITRFVERISGLHIRAERTFIAKMRRVEQPMILDAGCGPGRDTARFLRAGLKIVGVDNAEKLLKAGCDRFQINQGHLLCSELAKLPFNKDTFNGIWLRSVLGHFSSSDNLVILKELARVATPGALVFVRVREGSQEGIEKRDGFERFYKHYEREEVRDLMRAAGFQVRRIISLPDPDPEKFDYRQLNVWATLA